jgi:Tfp pilus assembly protein PilV
MRPENPNGFILLEVLVAMSLILGAWMASIGAYQGLALRLAQYEGRRSGLRQDFDAYELAERLRANSNQTHLLNPPNISSKGLMNESSRVPDRNYTLRSVIKSTLKN